MSGQPGELRRRILGPGQEPDPRFTLANERTFLAWIRTSLAFLAGGVALEAFSPGTFPAGVQRGVVFALVALAVVVALTAAYRWVRIERAMRSGAPLPVNLLAPVLAFGAAAVGVVALIVFATR